jgi:hypothetical protein
MAKKRTDPVAQKANTGLFDQIIKHLDISTELDKYTWTLDQNYMSQIGMRTFSLSEKNLINSSKEKLEDVVKKFILRLQVFVDTGVWKVHKEVHITDNKLKLQKLFISFNNKCLSIEKLAAEAGIKDFKTTKLYMDTQKVLSKAQDKIQTELKLRETRNSKFKFLSD